MKKNIVAALIILNVVSLHADPAIKITSECTFSVNTERFIQHLNMRNISKIFESTDGKVISIDGLPIHQPTAKQKKLILDMFVKCSR